MSGLVTDGGSGRHSVLYNWLVPNRNTKDDISVGISWVRGASVKGIESLECGSNGWIILDLYGGGWVCYSFAVNGGSRLVGTGTDCIDILVRVGLIPSMVQEGIVVVILCVHRRRRGWYW